MIAEAALEDAFNQNTKIWQVYLVPRDHQWHCRACEYSHVKSSHIAGGAGIQGLQRGNQHRPGLIIDSGDHLCVTCGHKTRQDRWTGGVEPTVTSPSVPTKFTRRAILVLGSRDIIEGTQ